MNIEASRALVPLENRALSVYLSIGGWSARKFDKKASKAVVDDNNAIGDAARVNKNLLAAADESLQKIRKLGDDARKYLEANTLPWDDSGRRMLPNTKSLQVVAELDNKEKAYYEAVDKFVTEYPVLRAQAIANLGDLANEEDYPQPDQVRHKFYFRLSLQPMPASFLGAERTGLSEQQLQGLEMHFKHQSSQQFSKALEVAWARLRESIEHLSTRLSPRDDDDSKTRIFRDSMLDNARETCALLKDLNVFGDPNLEDIRAAMESLVTNVDTKTLRESPYVAQSVKKSADDLLERMKAFA